MLNLIRKYRLGFLLYGTVAAAALLLILSVPRLELHVLMNRGHTDFLDAFFRIVTWLGDGWFAGALCLIFLFIRFRYSFMLILSFSISGLLAQLLKHLVFPDADRPSAFLEQMGELQTVPGVELFRSHSLPSGHATTAFAVLLLIGFISGNRPAFFFLTILAWCVAFSRVYLSQHFLVDVWAGSFIGTLSALFFYWYFQTLNPEWIDGSLLSLLKSRKKHGTPHGKAPNHHP